MCWSVHLLLTFFTQKAASREDAIQALQNEKIILEVALQAAQSSREEFDRGVKRLEEGAQDTSDTLEELRQELAIKSSQVTQFGVSLLLNGNHAYEK